MSNIFINKICGDQGLWYGMVLGLLLQSVALFWVICITNWNKEVLSPFHINYDLYLYINSYGGVQYNKCLEVIQINSYIRFNFKLRQDNTKRE